MAKVLKCDWCGDKFEPNIRQLGQRRRGRKSYCSPECCSAFNRDRAAKWWRTDEGRAYARARHTPKGDTK